MTSVLIIFFTDKWSGTSDGPSAENAAFEIVVIVLTEKARNVCVRVRMCVNMNTDYVYNKDDDKKRVSSKLKIIINESRASCDIEWKIIQL